MSVARSALFNLAGHLAPLAAALFALPVLVARLDPERFGFLSLAWVLVGYFSLFDLGLGRALSRIVAVRAGAHGGDDLAALTRTALLLTFALGAAAGVALALSARWLCATALHLSPALQPEAVTALWILAACLPFVTLTAALRGLLEAGQHFGWVNAIRIPLGMLSFAGPAAVVLASANLVALAAFLALLRLAGTVAHWVACRRLYPALVTFGRPAPGGVSEMLGFGAWLTVSNIVGPLMVYVDRFVIGAAISVSAVAYYTAPYEALTRLWLFPAALSGVLFPAFAAAREKDPQRVLRLYRIGVKATWLAIFPVTLAAAALAPEWMALWLGADYAARGALVAQILAAGVLVNCLAYLPFTLLQAVGRADLTAKTHLAELPLYLGVLWGFTQRWGIDGAALAWTLRCAADAAVLFRLSGRALPAGAGSLAPAQQASCIVFLALMLGALWPSALAVRGIYLAVALVLFCALAWLVLLTPEERRLVRTAHSLFAGGEAAR